MEVGWRLARAAWGQGFASEAAVAARGVAFTELELAEVNSITAVVNIRSRRLMERLGLRPAGEFEHPRVAPGSVLRPHVRYLIDAPGPTGAHGLPQEFRKDLPRKHSDRHF